MDDMARLHLLTATNCTNITFPSISQLHWKSPFHFSPSRLPDCSPAPVTRDFTMSETPFRPREQLHEKQKIFQSIHKHTYLKGPFDKITSVAIPAALAATSLFLIGRGIYNMSHGIGKKE